jgi:hypothetical protein
MTMPRMDEGRLCDIRGCPNPQCPGCVIEVLCNLPAMEGAGPDGKRVRFTARAEVCRAHHEYFTTAQLAGVVVSPSPFVGAE